jgi:hypothetical protein
MLPIEIIEKFGLNMDCKDDLLSAALVSKQWFSAFFPLFWRNLSIYSDDCIAVLRRGPVPDTVVQAEDTSGLSGASPHCTYFIKKFNRAKAAKDCYFPEILRKSTESTDRFAVSNRR